jgi:outer membrane protein assembly factor BamB
MARRVASTYPAGTRHALPGSACKSIVVQGRLALFAGALLLLAQAANPTVIAYQATPVATPVATALPARPDCPAPPVSPAALVAILREPVPEDPEAEHPRGEAVPPGERATIGDLAATWHRCLASGDVPALLGLFTADGVNRLLGERSPVLGGPAGLTIAILGVGNVQRLPDGRVAAEVTIDPSGRGEAAPEALTMVIEQGSDGAWRIDNLRAPEGPVGAAGTLGHDPEGPARALLRHPIAPGPNVPVPAPGPMVPMRGADVARTGIQTGLPPATEPGERWRTPAGWYSDAQPVAARGLVYFGGFSLGERAPLLAAIDAATGGVRWQTTAPVAWAEFPDAPALGGDILYAPVQAPVAGLMALTAATGEPLWFAPFGFTSVTAPVVDANAVYVAGWGVRNARDRAVNDAVGAVFALDPRTGRERWRYVANARFGTVAVGGDTVFVPSDHGLFALDRTTGAKRWQARFSPGPGEAPVVAGETVVFGGDEVTSGKSGVYALDAASGALRWRVDLEVATGTRIGTAVANDAAFVTWWDAAEDDPALGTPALRAFALADGKERWNYRAGSDPAGTGSVTPPAIAGGMALFGVAVRAPATGSASNADGLYAIDTMTGELHWHAGGVPIRSAPAVFDGAVYAMGGLRARGGASEGSLLAFRGE